MGFNAEKALTDAQEELESKIQRRADLDREISALRHAIEGLIQVTEKRATRLPYYWPWNINQGGLTSSCKTIVRTAERGLSPPEIRQQLELAGYDFATLSNPLSAIHTVLKRLVRKGELKASSQQGTTLYEWDDERAPRYNAQD